MFLCLKIEASFPLPRKPLGRVVHSICFLHDDVSLIRCKHATKSAGESKGIRVDSVCERGIGANSTDSEPRENIKTAFKPIKTLGNVFKKPKDRPTKEQLKGIVYKVSCRTCPFTYVGESK